MVLKKCNKCGSLVSILKDCECENCGLMCCGEQMKVVKANTSDGAVEKHKPEYYIQDDMLIIRVNHVMEEEHYIEWLVIEDDNVSIKYTFKAGDKPEVHFPYKKGLNLYAYCNKHGLWENVVEHSEHYITKDE